jgi:hypothetical protein
VFVSQAPSTASSAPTTLLRVTFGPLAVVPSTAEPFPSRS